MINNDFIIIFIIIIKKILLFKLSNPSFI